MPDPQVLLLCQSCGMPLAALEHFGTKADSTPTREYCCFCYRDGHYTDYWTLAQKVADSVSYHDESEKEQGRTLTRNELSVRMHLLLPQLKRWRSHDNCHTAYYEAVNRAVEYVNGNLDQPLSLKILAEVSCISQFHFHRIFRAVIGEAPEHYRVYACVSPPIKTRKLVKFTITGGEFAVFTHRGPYSVLRKLYCHIYRWWIPYSVLRKLYCHIYRWWIPYSGYRLRDSRYFERFLNTPSDTAPDELLTEIWIPVLKQ